MSSKELSKLTFCPKCGSRSFVSMNGFRSYDCEDCGFSYYINNSAAVACLILNDHGKLLVTTRGIEPQKGFLDLPGGFVEPGERIEEAVTREIQEELNLVVTDVQYMASFPNFYQYSDFVVPTIDLAVVCTIESFFSLSVGDDVASCEFMHPREIPLDQLCSDSMRNIVSNYISKYL